MRRGQVEGPGLAPAAQVLLLLGGVMAVQRQATLGYSQALDIYYPGSQATRTSPLQMMTHHLQVRPNHECSP